MQELLSAIPDVNVLLELEAEELAFQLLAAIQQRTIGQGTANEMVILSAVTTELFPTFGSGYPIGRQREVSLAIAEAWNWLEVQGLLLPEPGSNGRNGWRVLSRRAKDIKSAVQFAAFEVARRLSRDALHPRMAQRVWSAFVRGEYDNAAFQAMKAVEVAVRGAADLPDNLLGVSLMRKAFAVDDGPLTDIESEKGERQARADLFAGAIGSYKNPHSHRDVDLDDASEAIEIILLANHLLRIVDARERAAKGKKA